jgi:hypothetical protein
VTRAIRQADGTLDPRVNVGLAEFAAKNILRSRNIGDSAESGWQTLLEQY